MSDLAQEILHEQERLRSDRATWESHWQQIADHVLPNGAEFTVVREPGSRRTDKIVEATATLAAQNFVAAIVSMTMPRETRWHKLRSGIAELDARESVKIYFEQVTDLLFYYRYSPRANFTNQMGEAIASFGIFGTGPLWVDEEIGRGPYYRSVPLSEVFVREDQHGRIGETFRRSKMRAALWAARWGRDRLPPKVAQALAENQPNREFEFVHAIRPRRDHDPRAFDARAMPLESVVVAVEDRVIVRHGGFRTNPLLVPRYQTNARESYGRSPAMSALPEIKMAQQMRKTILAAAHQAVRPTLLTTDDGVLGRFSLKPGVVNRGALDFRGNPLVRPLEMGGNLPVGMEVEDQARKNIERAFMTPLFNVLTETPDRMTATEVLERAKEKAALLAPVAARIEAELLGPLVEREVDILAQMGVLPPMPPELEEAGAEYRITYDNPLQRAAMSERSIGMLRWIEAMAPVATQVPEVFDVPDWDKWARTLAEDQAIPLSTLRTRDEVQAKKAEDQAMQNTAMALQGAETAGKAAQALAQAQATAGAPLV